MIEHLARLSPATREVIDAPDDVRIRYMKSSRWITYTRAHQVLRVLDDLLVHPKKDRMPCMLLIGETNNGKSELVKHFMKKHAANENLDQPAIIQPVMYVQSPPTPDEAALYDEILKKLFEPTLKNEGTRQKRNRVCIVLKQTNLKMLFVDEIHHLLQGTPVKQRAFLNSLKYISNELSIPIVGIGTEEAQVAMSTSPELANRFKPQKLHRWTADGDAEAFLSAYECLLPLRKPSSLFSKEMVALVIRESEGWIGEMVELLVTAGTLAIESGEERITAEIVAECGYIGPAARDASTRNSFLPGS